MPTYEYVCSKCDQHLEVYQTFSEEPLKRHAGCGGKLTKVLGAVGIVLKAGSFLTLSVCCAARVNGNAPRTSDNNGTSCRRI